MFILSSLSHPSLVVDIFALAPRLLALRAVMPLPLDMQLEVLRAVMLLALPVLLLRPVQFVSFELSESPKPGC